MAKTARKPRPPRCGDVVEIPLAGAFAYGWALQDPLVAFFDLRAPAPLPPAQAVQAPVAFKVWVMHSAVTSGRWKVVGRVAPTEDDLVSPWFFKRDLISKKLARYRGGVTCPASAQECQGLENAAVWSAEHVESRLEDHFAGRPNRFVEAFARLAREG